MSFLLLCFLCFYCYYVFIYVRLSHLNKDYLLTYLLIQHRELLHNRLSCVLYSNINHSLRVAKSIERAVYQGHTNEVIYLDDVAKRWERFVDISAFLEPISCRTAAVRSLWTCHQVYFVCYCVTLTFAERNRLSFSLSGNKPLSTFSSEVEITAHFESDNRFR